MMRLRLSHLILIAILLSVFTEISFADKVPSGVVFIHNGQKFQAAQIREQPAGLKQPVQPGDTIAYRRYSGNKLIEDISGKVGEDMRIVFSNRVSFSARNKTIFEVFKKLEATHNLLDSQNLGYLN